MGPALILIDLQDDFLRQISGRGAAALVDRAAFLLSRCRELGVPVIHVLQRVTKDGPRMPHWVREGKWLCLEGTDGCRPPPALEPLANEPVITKTFFSGFSNPELEQVLDGISATTLVMAGVHLHGCIRATALDAYQRGFEVLIAEDATGSYDPVHSAVSRQWLEGRAAKFLSVEALAGFLADGAMRADQLVHRSPWGAGEVRWSSPAARAPECRTSALEARTGVEALSRTSIADRAGMLNRLASVLEERSSELVERLALDIGKPVSYGAGEVTRAIALIRAAARAEAGTAELEEASVRRRPLGVVAVVTAFNNPIAVPLGKIAPALLFGNSVVWKPAPAGSAIAARVLELAGEAGLPHGALGVVHGDGVTAVTLAGDSSVDAVTLTGSTAAGHALQVVSARRGVPFQGELGGNNASIVWGDADLDDAARQVAEGGFGCAGQRCTANRRVVVDERCSAEFIDKLLEATAALRWGDPLEREVSVGPLVSESAKERVAAAVERARSHSWMVCSPHEGRPLGGAFYPPTVIGTDFAGEEIVQEETFGPVIVIQRASDFTQALELCNCTRYGLIAALFSASPELQEQFLEKARVGVLKINQSTAGAGINVPFGGWKASGAGPPEHGSSNLEFYTRAQSVYSNQSHQGTS